MARRSDARRADHVEAGVALLAEERHAGVEPHPDLDADLVRPVVVADPRLAGEGRRERGLASSKTAESSSPVASTSTPPLAAISSRRSRRTSPISCGYAEPRSGRAGRPLDVGEEERDGACWQLGHGLSLEDVAASGLSGCDSAGACPIAGRTGIVARIRVPPRRAAADLERAVERLDAVDQPLEPRAERRIAPPMPSSAISTTTALLFVLGDPTVARCAGVLGDVGKRLGGDVVGGGLDRGREPLGGHVELDRDGERDDERLERRAEAAIGEDVGWRPRASSGAPRAPRTAPRARRRGSARPGRVGLELRLASRSESGASRVAVAPRRGDCARGAALGVAGLTIRRVRPGPPPPGVCAR